MFQKYCYFALLHKNIIPLFDMINQYTLDIGIYNRVKKDYNLYHRALMFLQTASLLFVCKFNELFIHDFCVCFL